MKKRYQIIFIVLALLLLYFVLSKVGFSKILQSLEMLKWYYLLIAAALNLFVFIIWNYKWKLLVDKVSKVRFWELFPIEMTGIFVGTSTPTLNLGGDPLRVYYVSKKFKKEQSKYVHTVVIDKLTNVAIWTVFIFLSLLFLSIFLKVSTLIKVIIESLIIIILLLIGLFIFYKKTRKERIVKMIHPLFRKKFPDFNKFIAYLREQRENIKVAIKEFYRNKKELNQQILLGVFAELTMFAKAYLLFILLGYNINPIYVIIAVSISIMISQIIIVPGGIGVVESSLISMYALMGINAEIAAIVAILDRVMYYIFALGLGYLMFSYTHYKYSKH